MTAVTTDDKQQIKEIILDILELEEDEISETSLFVEEHDADSMRLIEILSSLELNFNVTIEQADMPRMVNLAGVYEVVSEAAR
ncbi:acyl carrier protein [Streptomyces sp. NPDC091371]|uniref:acyl carrier protein n=1 Tax=Streptomyces sp. NPDC091371 TaxID=3155303 RepID=UPI003417A6D8